MYTLEFYEDEQGHEPVLDWLRRLAPRKRRAIGVAMFEILQHEGPRVVGTNFGKGLGEGLFEFRLDQDATQVLARKGKRARHVIDDMGFNQCSEKWEKVRMATKFRDFMAELKREAEAEGPDAVAELKYFRDRYRLARRFAEARRKRGWTQKKLAQKTGLNQSEISTFENGQANPTYKTLQCLAAALGGKIELVIS